MNRRTLAVTILLAWFGALGWLFARRLVDSTNRQGNAIRRLGPGSVWYGYELAGVPVGSMGLTVDTLTSGFTFLQVWGLDGVGASEIEGRQALRLQSTLSRTFRLQVAHASANEAGRPLTVDMAATPDSLAVFRHSIPGEPRRTTDRVPLWAGILPATVTFRLGVEGRLTPGGTIAVRTLDPLRGVTDSVIGRVTGDSLFILTDSATVDTLTGIWTPVVTDSVRTWRVELSSPAGETQWVTDEGWPVLIEHAFGATLRRSAFELVENAYNRARQLEAIPRVVRPAGLSAVVELGLEPNPTPLPRRMVLGRTDDRVVPDGALLLSGGRQRAAGDTLVIEAEGVAGAEPLSSHLRYNEGLTATERTMLSRGLSLAMQRVGNSVDTVAAITRWVARDLLKDLTVAAPISPVHVLTTGRGGPEGKARLVVALARLAGYPARVVSGVLVTDPRLPWHTWAEVWRDRWLAVDPTFGHVPASTALLRVMEGPARTIPMLTAVGALRVTTADPRRDPRP